MAAQMTIELARVRYWQGQLLSAGDLQTQLRADEELRRLHNRAVHQAYGIAIGLTPTLDEGELKLDCGMAYDCAGRALIVEAARTLDLPTSLTGGMTLVLTYAPASADGVALNWKPASEVNANVEVALTRVIPGLTQPEIDPQFRPIVARPLARPRMATGNTIPGETPWEPWLVDASEVGVKVLIDTSAAGFTRVPHYFAEAIAGKPTANFIPAWFASIADPTTQGFTLQLRIISEPLVIVDPKAQVVEPPTLEPTLVLSEKAFVLDDLVARLLPLVKRAVKINTLSGKNVTLDDALTKFTDPKNVAFGHAPRVATVTQTSNPASFTEVSVDTPDAYNEGDVVVDLGVPPPQTHPAKIFSIAEDGTLEFLKPIDGLTVSHSLGVAQFVARVQTVNEASLEITVDNETPFVDAKDKVLVRMDDPVETSTPARITAVSKNKLTLSTWIKDLRPPSGQQQGSPLGLVQEAGNVLDLSDNQSEVKIGVDDTRKFRKGDLIAKQFANGTFSAPVRVQHIPRGGKTLTLSGSIPTLIATDTIVAADFPVRATVLGVGGTGDTTLTVNDATPFPQNGYVARIDELLNANLPAEVKTSGGKTLTLGTPLPNLKAGDVIGLCVFPVSVKVQEVQGDGAIVLSDSDLLHEGDVVSALPQRPDIALVGQVAGNTLRLVGEIANLAAGDTLVVTTINGAVTATPTANNNKVTVDQYQRLRADDFLADITGWRQSPSGSLATAFVIAVNDKEVSLFGRLDGLLKFDIIGLPSMPPTVNSEQLLSLRLGEKADITFGDQALVVAFDQLRGETISTSAFIKYMNQDKSMISLTPERDLSGFTFRPEDVSVSVLFVHGRTLSLIRQNELYVNWLAVGESDEMPRPCAGADEPTCPCAEG